MSTTHLFIFISWPTTPHFMLSFTDLIVTTAIGICNAPINWYNITTIASVHFDHTLRLLVGHFIITAVRLPPAITPSHQQSTKTTANCARLASFISSRATTWLIVYVTCIMQYATTIHCHLIYESLCVCVCEFAVHSTNIHHNYHNH